ncbi:GEVED domain-containing protein [Algivirga pacifica]
MKMTGIVLSLLLLTFQAQAQTPSTNCNQFQQRQKLLQNESNFKRIQKAEDFLQQHTEAYRQLRRVGRIAENVLTIPIVFHVIHNNGIENISDEQIIEAVAQINEDFNALNPGSSNIIPEFQNLQADVNLEFRLAQLDPNGNPTTGITRHQSSLTVNGSSNEYEIKTTYGWPRDQYLNVWVVYSSDGNNGSGYAYYPSSIDDEGSKYRDGVIVSHWAVGRTGTAASTHYKLLTHEIGHWANLKHTWGDESNNGESSGCSYDDGVTDTPLTIGSTGCATDVYSCGSLDNAQNYMDYSSCPEMFTLGQKDRMRAAITSPVGRRSNLWSAENLSKTLITGNPPYALFDTFRFTEYYENNGTIGNEIICTLKNTTFATSSGTLSPGVDYEVSGLPQGLSPVVTVMNDSTATFSISGNTTAHTNGDDLEQISFTFKDTALNGGNANALLNTTTNNFSLDFIDPYQVVYKNIDDITANANQTWNYFTLDGLGNVPYGIWYDGGKLRIETYTKALIAEGSTRNISLLTKGTLISQASNWVNGGSYPNEHDLRSNDYTLWDGQEGYIGFKVENAGLENYGWFHVQVTAAGDAFTLLDYAFNEAPFESINAGEVGVSTLTFSNTSMTESNNNNGTFSSTITIKMLDGAFSKQSGVFSEGTDYTISGLPAGLSASITLNDLQTATLSLSGSSNPHTENENGNFSVNFLDPAFQGLIASEVSNSSFSIAYNFRDPYQVIHTVHDTPLRVEEGGNTWSYFSFSPRNDYGEYGVFYDENDATFKLEAYTKEAITEGSSFNLSLLTENSLIDNNQNWTNGGAYPDLHVVASATYTSLHGQTGYLGLRFNIEEEIHYGWAKISVDQDGKGYTLTEMAYNTEPGVMIKAGQTTLSNEGTPVITDFTANTTTIQEGESIQFNDLSANTPTSWSWTFEGGTPASSTQQNPTVTYSTPGTYAVSLTASNAYGSDSMSKLAYITVTEVSDGTYCAAITTMDNNYIDNVSFGDIDNSSAWDGYADYSGSANTSVITGTTIPLTISANIEYWPYITAAAWIDWNQDGDFDDAGEEVYQFEGSGPFTTDVNIPQSATLGTTRMRVRLGYSKTLTPCGTDTYQGEVEDYSITISTESTPITYCDASSDLDYDMITNVSLGDINHSSQWASYNDFTAQSTSLGRGESYPLTIALDIEYWDALAVAAWIDWNQDGDFDDTGEEVYSHLGQGPYQGTVNVPTTASIGNTRMRVRMGYYDAQVPCGVDTYFGEVEDYTIAVTGNNAGQKMVLGIENTITAFSVYPNPSYNGQFFLELPKSNLEKNITIFNLHGQIVHQELLPAGKNKIVLKEYHKGLHLIQVISGEKVGVQKLLLR